MGIEETLSWMWDMEHREQQQRPIRWWQRLRRWFIARRLGLRCLVCGRRAGYGGVCPDPEHNW